jgi:SSS family solute:Na+ symporter
MHPFHFVRSAIEGLMPDLPLLDGLILVVYLAVLVGWGCGFVRTATSAEAYMSAGRSLPGWVVGLSMFGSFVSTLTFLGNPAKSWAGNWNTWVFALSLPFAAVVAARWFVPFFRQSGEISAYHHLEHRFGAWARTYGVVCYMLTQIARLGATLFLLATALHGFVGGHLAVVIAVLGIAITIYPLFGGTEGVIWTGVVQAIVLVLGAAACLAQLLLTTPGGVEAVFATGWYEDKFSLGPYTSSVSQPTFFVVLIYGLVMNLQNFGIDQSYVQRYITAESDVAARRSVWMSAICYIPLSAAFLLIGTALFVFYRAHPQRLPEGLASDAIFPQFMHTELPVGLRGLVLAAICSAAMDSNLNCCATLYLCDIHRRYFRPQASDRESLWVLRMTTVVMGAISIGTAIAMIGVKSALDEWWKLAGIFSGGILGLFLLGRLSRAANARAGFLATVAGVCVIVWMTLFPRTAQQTDWWRSPFNANLTIVFGTLTIIAFGMLLSLFRPFQRTETT